ncbi:carbon starvation protein A [Desulfosediminicola ganghwensis]|uniref:carbon starvation CstA family protein n=1 Tax=Desulfosediminicola ganghwensis TaxID=2569540 RepID=UPI0010ACE172|nr:carbon starvation protein A [Desulfosediminicola ganghwensis]
MIIFFASVAALIIGYLVYGAVIDRIFGADPNRKTPAETMQDGVDYLELPPWKIFLIQLLNIAGLGPIFGPILGALYGPVALVWIVLGAIFAGAVHDYFSGMLSVRYNGQSVPDVVGQNLGMLFKQFMRGFSVILLILVGVVFFLAPAELLQNLTGIDVKILVGIILAYYFMATILPIDKIIGRVYPIFGAILIFMAVGLMTMLIAKGYDFYPQRTLVNVNPQNLPLWPLMFITIACGAVSGFHATQSPLMARCLPNEKYGRSVFYGSMIAEGVIALIWCTLAISFFHTPEMLNKVLGEGGPGLVVNQVSTTLLGPFGGVLAIIGVVLLPITSGDTAFRSARLILADTFKLSQVEPVKRLLIAVPLFAVGFLISLSEYGLIWRYFGWANQTLATVVLWAAAMYLLKHGKLHWVASLPATFMTVVVVTFLANSGIGFGLPMNVSTSIGLGVAFVIVVAFFNKARTLRIQGKEFGEPQ